MGSPAALARSPNSARQLGGRPPVATSSATPDAEPYCSLAALATTMEALASAVVRHDAAALEAATGLATDLVARIERLAADGLEPTDSGLDRATLHHLAARLEASARLAAQLIERAWGSEAAALHLLARCLGAARPEEPYRLHPAGSRDLQAPAGALVERRA